VEPSAGKARTLIEETKPGFRGLRPLVEASATPARNSATTWTTARRSSGLPSAMAGRPLPLRFCHRQSQETDHQSDWVVRNVDAWTKRSARSVPAAGMDPAMTVLLALLPHRFRRHGPHQITDAMHSHRCLPPIAVLCGLWQASICRPSRSSAALKIAKSSWISTRATIGAARRGHSPA